MDNYSQNVLLHLGKSVLIYIYIYKNVFVLVFVIVKPVCYYLTMRASDPNSLSVYTDPDAHDIRISQRQFFSFILYLYRKKYDVHCPLYDAQKLEICVSDL